MPKSIILYERFAYLSLIAGLIAPLINWPVIARTQPVSPGFMILVALISLALQLFLIRKIVRRRNWARWTFIVLLSFGAASQIVIEFFRPHQMNGIAGYASYYLSYVAAILAAYFLLTSEARIWFRSVSERVS